MSSTLTGLNTCLKQVGIDLPKFAVSVPNILRYIRDRRAFISENSASLPPIGAIYPVLDEFEAEAGTASGHYFHMDLWAARKVFLRAPNRHVDIGSRVDGFVAHLLTFREVEVVDIRELTTEVEGLFFLRSDASSLSCFSDGSLISISCLHAAEHFGLGRYGDPVSPFAYKALLNSLARVLLPGGYLYFAVPIGRERVEFNAHRVFAPGRIPLEMSSLQLVSFSAVNDDGKFIKNASPGDFEQSEMACGLYEFMKPV